MSPAMLVTASTRYALTPAVHSDPLPRGWFDVAAPARGVRLAANYRAPGSAAWSGCPLVGSSGRGRRSARPSRCCPPSRVVHRARRRSWVSARSWPVRGCQRVAAVGSVGWSSWVGWSGMTGLPGRVGWWVMPPRGWPAARAAVVFRPHMYGRLVAPLKSSRTFWPHVSAAQEACSVGVAVGGPGAAGGDSVCRARPAGVQWAARRAAVAARPMARAVAAGSDRAAR